jgi:hypothetical protein
MKTEVLRLFNKKSTNVFSTERNFTNPTRQNVGYYGL